MHCNATHILLDTTLALWTTIWRLGLLFRDSDYYLEITLNA